MRFSDTVISSLIIGRTSSLMMVRRSSLVNSPNPYGLISSGVEIGFIAMTFMVEKSAPLILRRALT